MGSRCFAWRGGDGLVRAAPHCSCRGVLENLVEVLAVEAVAFTQGFPARISLQYSLHLGLQLREDDFRVRGSVQRLEVKFDTELVEFSEQRGLITPKTRVHILTGEDVHAGFPIVEPAGEDHAWDQLLDVHAKVKYCVGNQSGAVNPANPRRVHAANNRARHQRIDVAVGEHDKARTQRGNHFVLQAIDKIGGVEKALRHAAKIVSFLRAANSFTSQRRPCHSCIEHGVTQLLEPRPQHIDLRGAARAVCPLQYQQLACKIRKLHSRQPFSVGLSHGRTLRFLARSRCVCTIWRTCACWTSTGSVASITVRPNSGIIFSYSSTMRPWNKQKLSVGSSLKPMSSPAS